MKTGIFFILFLVCSFATKAENSPIILKQTIPLPNVEGRFDHFAIDEKGARLFVAALGNNTLEVVDLKHGKRLQSIRNMKKPTGVAYIPDSNRIFAGNGDDGSLKILDGESYKIVQSIGSLDDADNVRFDAKNKRIYCGYGDGALAIVDSTNGRLLGHIALKGHPESFQLEQNGSRIFVNVPDAKQIAVIDREKREVVQTWQMKHQANFPMALDESNHRLFVGFRSPARLVVFDTANGNPVSEIEISGDADDLFYDAKRKRIYISCGEGFVDVVEQESPDNYRRAAKIPTSTGARTSFFSAARDEFYLAVPHRGNQQAEIRIYQVK